VADISADIRDENIWYFAMWRIGGAFTNAFEEFLQKVSIPYEPMILNLL